VQYLRRNKHEVGDGRNAYAEKGQEGFTMTGKYGYLAVVLLSAVAVAVFATQLGGVWSFPSAQPRMLTVFRMQEGLAVAPAQ
jgi:hypothetical protein